MLTDEQLKKVRFMSVSHASMSTYYVSTYKSINVEPTIWMHLITPRKDVSPNECGRKEYETRPRYKQKQFRCMNYTCARIETLNKKVPLKLIEVL